MFQSPAEGTDFPILELDLGWELPDFASIGIVLIDRVVVQYGVRVSSTQLSGSVLGSNLTEALGFSVEGWFILKRGMCPSENKFEQCRVW